MTIKQFVLAAAIALGTAPAFAADQTIDLSSGQASFVSTGTVLDGGDDVITFANLASGSYDFLFSLSSQNIGGLTATLNGQAADIISAGKFSFASLESTGNSDFVLTLTGLGARGALYSGELTVAPVPEPETYALMMAGLGAVGFMARRRKKV